VAFDPPLRSEMGAVVLRALRDTKGSVFPAETVNDFISQAMADLSSYRPKEAREVAAWPLDLPPAAPFQDFTSIWKVDFRVSTSSTVVRVIGIPYGDSNSAENRAGWDFYAGQLIIPTFWLNKLDATAGDNPAEMVVWGYQDRAIPVSDGDVLDLTDAADYNCVLNHCKALGFELLTHDRALYQQWLAATNNTDVSPTQLSGMAGQAEGTFQRTRSRNTKMRRIASGDYVHAY
jgi:hypothetical protein